MALKKIFRPVVTALTMGAAVGCAKGPIPGHLMRTGEPAQVVTLNYESNVFGGGGTLWALLPDGQRYSGKYVLMPYAPEHHMVSTLDGDRGGSMVCRFTLNQPGVGPDGGGTGTCQISQGGVIEAKF